MRRIGVESLAVIFVIILGLFFSYTYSQENVENKSATKRIVGVVKEIAEDGSKIVLNDTQKDIVILTTKEFLNYSYLEVGDEVEIIAKETSAGLHAVDFNYIFEKNATVGDN